MIISLPRYHLRSMENEEPRRSYDVAMSIVICKEPVHQLKILLSTISVKRRRSRPIENHKDNDNFRWRSQLNSDWK